jgi:1,4-dihydroxy-2-naphthoate octaprenyltransferase
MLLVAYVTLIPVVFPLSAWVLLPVVTLPLAARLARTVRAHVDGPTLNAALAQTGMLQLGFCVLLSVGILAS